jgi:uncharacterized protein YqgC (DUF456 family)
VGLIFMPLLGAMTGEYWSQRKQLGAGAGRPQLNAAGQQAAKVGMATWVGLLLGTVIKIVIVFLMIGVFTVALWL